jgi:hypothetical protein
MYKLAILFLGLALVVPVAYAEKVEPLSVKDVIKMIENQVEEELIIAQTLSSGLKFEFDEKNVFKLMDGGASEDLLIQLILKHGSKFQTTPDNIVKLQEKGASNDFISFLQNPATYTVKKADIYGHLDLNMDGSWTAKSEDNLNVFFGVYVDGERRTTLNQWTEVVSVSTRSGDITTYKLEPGSISVANIPEGTHDVEIVMWSGTGSSADRYPSGVIWNRSVNITAEQRTDLNLEAFGTDGDYGLR